MLGLNQILIDVIQLHWVGRGRSQRTDHRVTASSGPLGSPGALERLPRSELSISLTLQHPVLSK